jgi:hypothetical protein
MSSLTNVIGLIKVIVKDRKNQQKMTVPLDYKTEDLVRRLDRCMSRLDFDQWHRVRLLWVHREAKNWNLARLCSNVATALHSAVSKAELLRHHARHNTPLPTCYWSARHLVVSALGNILSAFEAFRVVYSKPDLNAAHTTAMIRVYLRETFHLLFLFAKLASPRGPKYGYFARWWKESLAESNFEDFKFDNEVEYARLDRPLMNDTNLTGVLGDPARMPGLCLPFHPSRQAVCLNTGPYGSAILRDL